MQFKILGPLDVMVDGGSVTPRSAKIRTLLTFFCIKSGMVVSKAAIMDALWPDDPPERPAPPFTYMFRNSVNIWTSTADAPNGC